LVLQRDETWLVYLTTLDYSRNKEARAVPFVKRQDVVEDRKESPRDWGVWKTRNTKIVHSYRSWEFSGKTLSFLRIPETR
jgi:hypothetical protein